MSGVSLYLDAVMPYETHVVNDILHGHEHDFRALLL